MCGAPSQVRRLPNAGIAALKMVLREQEGGRRPSQAEGCALRGTVAVVLGWVALSHLDSHQFPRQPALAFMKQLAGARGGVGVALQTQAVSMTPTF